VQSPAGASFAADVLLNQFVRVRLSRARISTGLGVVFVQSQELRGAIPDGEIAGFRLEPPPPADGWVNLSSAIAQREQILVAPKSMSV
jgi:hypothetical protein